MPLNEVFLRARYEDDPVGNGLIDLALEQQKALTEMAGDLMRAQSAETLWRNSAEESVKTANETFAKKAEVGRAVHRAERILRAIDVRVVLIDHALRAGMVSVRSNERFDVLQLKQTLQELHDLATLGVLVEELRDAPGADGSYLKKLQDQEATAEHPFRGGSVPHSVRDHAHRVFSGFATVPKGK